MNKTSRANLTIGILLILIGGWFLAVEYISGLEGLLNIELVWPLGVVGVGVFILILGLLMRVPNMAIPACIVGGIGGVLYWQFITDKWESWAYTWALIPGFVGVGIILARLLGNRDQGAFRAGIKLIIICIVLFAVSYLFLSGQGVLREYWPILVILLGIWIFTQALLKQR